MKIEVKGPIISDGRQWIYDWLEMPATSPAKINKALLNANGEDVEISINSGGGSVFAGSEIYTALKSYEGNVKGQIVGLAASAASVIAMGVNSLEISPTAQIMIHRASTWGDGNAEDLQKTVDMLEGIDKSIANAYVLKTGIKHSELLDMMSKETWLDADKAKELGFADSIMFENEIQAVASIGDGMIPEEIVNKILEKFKSEAELENKVKCKETPKNKELEIAKAKLQLQINM